MDIYIECVNCEELFRFSEGEQRFYRSKGFDNPKRCKECRKRGCSDRCYVRTSNYFENAQIFGPGLDVHTRDAW